MTYSLPQILHGAQLAVFINYAVVFFLDRRSEKAPMRIRHAAGTVMLILAFQCMLWFLGIAIDDPLEGTMINVAVVPFIVFLMHELTMKKTMLSVCVPCTLFFVLMIPAYIAAKHFCPQYVSSIIAYLDLSLMAIYIVVYFLYFHRILKKYNKNVDDYYSDTDEHSLKWVTKIFVFLIILTILFVALRVVFNDEIFASIFVCSQLILWGMMSWNILHMKETAEFDAEDSAIAEMPDVQEPSAPTGEFAAKVEEICRSQNLFRRPGLTRDDVAMAMGTNHTTLTRKLKEDTGMTFSDYINSMRLAEAAKLLAETDEYVEQIAYKCGYSNKSTFYRLFSEKYSCTPIDYRKRKA